MTEHENNRVHYLLDACDARGHLDVSSEDMALILRHQRELGKEDALADLAEHDKAVIRKFAEWAYDHSVVGVRTKEARIAKYIEEYEKEKKK